MLYVSDYNYFIIEMGLDYLNKKVWHPGSMKNIQKVWDAQQSQLQNIKRQKQRAKKLQDQKYNEQMKRIQVEAGLIPRSHLDRMDWMYDQGNKLQQQKNSQEFLTGNKKANKKQVKHICQQQVTNRKCQDFVLLHEDPLYAIQREQMKARQSIMSNPIQMKNIIEQVEEDYLKMKRKNKEDTLDKRDRKSKKDKKKKKHRKQKQVSNSSTQRIKNSKRQRSYSSSSSSSSSSGSSSSRQRSRSKSSKSSKLLEDYMKKTFGGILKKDQKGNLVPDYGMHKKKYKTQIQLDEQQRRQKLQQMRQNARKVRQNRSRSPSPEQKNNFDYESGLAKIRQHTYENIGENRNKKKLVQYD